MNKKVNHILHKSLLIVIFAVFIFSASAMRCGAEGQIKTDVESQIDGAVDKFYEIIPEGSEQYADIGSIAQTLGIKEIFKGVFDAVSGKGGELGTLLALVLGTALLSSLASLGPTATSSVVSGSVCVVSSAILLERLIFLADGVRESLGEINSFFSAVIPVTLTVNSLGTSPTTATAQALGMGLTLGLYSYVCSELLTFVAGLVFIASAASAIDPVFGRIAKGIKSIFLTAMGILTALIGAVFSLQSTICASADSAVMRGAKYAVSSTVPIVGNAISGAMALLSGGVEYARGVVGAGAIAVIISLILAPLAVLLAYRGCLALGSFLVGLFSERGGCEVVSSFVAALDTLVAVYSLTSVVYIIELVAFLKGGARLA